MSQLQEKSQYKWFYYTDFLKEQAYLEKMAREGWCFTGKTVSILYNFVPAEPIDMVYQIDYNPKAISKDPTYIQMFADAGWEFCYTDGSCAYFRKPRELMKGEEEIYCDDASKLQHIKKRFRNRLLFLVLLFVIDAFLAFFYLFYRAYLNAAMYAALVAIILVTIIIVFIKYYRTKKILFDKKQ